MEDELEALAEEFTTWLLSWGRAKTVAARRTLIRNRLAAWGHPEQWNTLEVQRFLTWGEDGERRKEWTTSTYYAHLRCFGRWLLATEVMDTDPTAGISKTAKPSNLPRPLPESDVPRVLAAATPRQRAWLLLALHAGFRAHEVAKVRGEDVTEDLIYVDGKGGKSAVLPTHPDLWALAQDYPRRGYWFPSGEAHLTGDRVSHSISELFTKLGIDGSIHRCRHTFGTRLVRAGVDLRRVHHLMRHSSLATTEGYLQVADAGLRDAIRLLPGA